MKTIGILGGMGPAATADFYRRIVEVTAATHDQEHLHILIESNPGVPDRTAFLLGQGEDPTPTLLTMARTLQQAGAQLLVLACNTANVFAPRIASEISVPLFHWVDEIVTSISILQPELRQFGLLATSGTLASGIYQQAFQQRGITTIVPLAHVQTQVMSAIYGPSGIKVGNTNINGVHESIRCAENHLQNVGAQAVLLACTELSLFAASHLYEWSLPTFDAAQVAAERLVSLAGGQLR